MNDPALKTTDDRFDREGDALVRALFTPAELTMTPEEYAARHAHEWGCFAYHRYRYHDPALGAWVRRLGEIFSSDEELQRCRQRYLTASELAAIEQQEAEGF